MKKRSDRAHGGFTLVEMMVVTAVVAVLVVLLLPVLSQAKARAQQVDCMNRQRQWAAAFLMYVDDNENFIPREGYDSQGEVKLNTWVKVKGIVRPGDGTSDSDDVWYNALAQYVSVPPASYYAPSGKQDGFYKSASMFHCPSAKIPAKVQKPKYLIALFSMAMNSQLIEFPHGSTIRFDRLRNEEPRTVLFLDNLLDDEKKVHPWQESDNLGQPAAYADRFSARHSGGGNLAFADGHVLWFPGRKVVETDPTSPLRGGPVMPPIDIVWEPDYDF